MRMADVKQAMRHLPIRDLAEIVRGTVLILAPHPDDESLGCGGLIAECVARGQPPVVAILTDGTGSHPRSRAYPPDRLRAVREQEARDAVAVLGLSPDRVHFMRRLDTAAPQDGTELEAAAMELADLAREQRCQTILTSWAGDPHCDHLAAARIAERCRAITGMDLLFYPVWGWTRADADIWAGPAPDGARLDIATHMARKHRAIAAHQSQYGALIHDDPTGFRLPPDLLAAFDQPFEVFLTRA